MRIDARKHQKALSDSMAFLVTAARRNKHITSLGAAALLILSIGAASSLTENSDSKQVSLLDNTNKAQIMALPLASVSEDSKSIIFAASSQHHQPEFSFDRLAEEVDSYRTVGFRGTELMVSGQSIGFFKSGQEADTVLDAVKAPYVKETLQHLYFKESVQQAVRYTYASKFNGFSSVAETLQLIRNGSETTESYVVQEGENLWAIAKKLNKSVDELVLANPTVVPEKIKAGQVLSLSVKKSLMTVCTVEKIQSVVAIPFEVSYQDNKKLFKGDTKIITAGTPGKKAVEAKIVKENGVVVAREVLSEVVLDKAKPQVVAKGTKAKLTASVSGKLAKPFSRGTFTSPFGRRWGKLHKGNDFSMPIGSNILAAESGRVEKISFEKDGYGLHVIINHGNGLKTVYAHCSKTLVKVGDRVSLGQKIALSGQTGRAYNPHLHFEVYKSGVAVDPMKYLLIKK